MGLPPKCNPCCRGGRRELCCTHRRFDGSWLAAWSRHIGSQRECTARIIDLRFHSDVLYLVAWSKHESAPVAQAWDTDGVRQWTVDLPAGYQPRRVASDGTRVFVAGSAGETGGDLLALDASDGSDLWNATIAEGGYSVCTDGSGGCFVGTGGFQFVDCAEQTVGSIRRYSSGGTLQAHFGRGLPVFTRYWQVRDVLVLGGKLWAGSGGYETQLCCGGALSVQAPWRGHLARYTFDGTLELLCSNPPTGVAGSETRHQLPADSWVNRLATVDGRLFAGYQRDNRVDNPYRLETLYCGIAEWDPDSGRLVAAYDLETDDSGASPQLLGIDGLAAGSNFLAATFDQLSLATLDLSGSELKSLAPVLLPAVDSSDNVYGALQRWRCDEQTPDVDATIAASGVLDDCVCGRPTPFGRIHIDCGCDEEDDGVPCSWSMAQYSTGCMAGFPESVTLHLTHYLPAGHTAVWEGSFTWEPAGCEYGFHVTVRVTYECPGEPTGTGGGTWTIRYTFSTPLVVTPGWYVEVTASEQSCEKAADGGPSFTFEATEADTPVGTVDGCLECGSWTIGGPPDETVDVCGCTGIPTTLTATFTDAGCTHLDDATITLTWDGSDSWDGSGTVCGVTFSLSMTCSGSDFYLDIISPTECRWAAFNPTQNTTKNCDAFQVEFGISVQDASCPCCDSAPSGYFVFITA